MKWAAPANAKYGKDGDCRLMETSIMSEKKRACECQRKEVMLDEQG